MITFNPIILSYFYCSINRSCVKTCFALNPQRLNWIPPDWTLNFWFWFLDTLHSTATLEVKETIFYDLLHIKTTNVTQLRVNALETRQVQIADCRWYLLNEGSPWHSNILVARRTRSLWVRLTSCGCLTALNDWLKTCWTQAHTRRAERAHISLTMLERGARTHIYTHTRSSLQFSPERKMSPHPRANNTTQTVVLA